MTLPDASTNEIAGLVEYLSSRGGRGEVFRIATDTNREFGRVIAVIKAAEILDLVDTPRRAVILTETGHRFAAADAEERKRLWREQILQLRIFREVQDLIEKQEGRRIDATMVQEILVMRLPRENYEKVFDTLIRWGRFGDLFAYDQTEQMITLA